MSKQFKSINYADRMQNPVYKCKPVIPKTDTYVLHEELVYNEQLGRMLPKSSFKKVDKHSLSHLKVSDFSLENLQSIGAPLSPCTMKHDINTATSIMENNVAMFNNSNLE